MILDWRQLRTDPAEPAGTERAQVEHRRDFVFERAPVALALLDVSGRILDTNSALQKLVGSTGGQLRLTSVDALFEPGDLLPEVLLDSFRGGECKEVRVEVRLCRDSGRRTWVRLSLSPVCDADGAAVGLVAALEDITSLKETEAAVQQRDEFLAAIAHDLKAPLAAIKGRAELLTRRITRGSISSQEQLTAALVQIDASATRMAIQIDELLGSVRIRGRTAAELYLQPTDLVALVRDVAEEYGATSEQHSIRLEANESELIGLWNAPRLERVVSNLLGNAIKYSPEGGEILVTVAREIEAREAWATITVSDRGIGIPRADLPHVFERFFRAANVDGVAGSGIGLAGAKQIVEQHGGTIHIQSEEGHGTSITVRLPLESLS